jgi:hypothetical protein
VTRVHTGWLGNSRVLICTHVFPLAAEQNVPLCLSAEKRNVAFGVGVGTCGILEHFSLYNHSLLELGSALDGFQYSPLFYKGGN